MHVTQTDTNIYLYDHRIGQLITYSPDELDRDILSDPNIVDYYANSQRINDTDVSHTYYNEHNDYWCYRKQHSFFQNNTGPSLPEYLDELSPVNIRDLHHDYVRRKQTQQNTNIDDPYAYMHHHDFRRGPVVQQSRRKSHDKITKKTRRHVKHSRFALIDVARYSEDITFVNISIRKAKDHSIFNWDPPYRKISRSWKDQSKQNRQWGHFTKDKSNRKDDQDDYGY